MNIASGVALVVAAASVGMIAWAGPAWAISWAVLLPALWSRSESRFQAGMTVGAYQLAATHGAPIGIGHYYGTVIASGVLLWVTAAVIVAVPWALFWSADQRVNAHRVPWALFATAVPPVGIVGWVHPITAAGILFPGTGWSGLAACVMVLSISAAIPFRWLPFAAFGFVFWAALLHDSPRPAVGMRGVDTCEPVGVAVDFGQDFDRQLRFMSIAAARDDQVLVFPESAGGRWNRVSADLWCNALSDVPSRLVLLGAQVADADGRESNALVAVAAAGAQVVYRQRMPVPLSMWRPWDESGTRAHWFENPVVKVTGVRSAVFICHEQVIVWPMLHSMILGPDVIIGCSNLWWCADTTIPHIQLCSLGAWARLFDVPLVTATNR